MSTQCIAYSCLAIVLMLVVFIASATQIFSIVVGWVNINYRGSNNTCNIGLVTLSEWLIVSGIYGLVLLLVIIVLMILVMVYRWNDWMRSVTIYILSAINGLFLLFWIIVGGLSLFRDNMKCLNKEENPFLWVVTLIIWIASFINLCGPNMTLHKQNEK